MSKKILVNATQHEENRVAIVEDGILTELDIEVAGHEPTKGNIYKAVVVRVESGLQAAFVDYGAERLGFLQIDEINYKAVKPDYQPAEDGRRPRITDLLQRGQELLVQITKEERGTKGAALTTYLSLAGRFMVIMPGSQTRGVSRKAESDSQRKELKKAMSSLDLAENIGYIVRTAALDQTREELDRDYRYLLRLFENITSLAEKTKAPTLIYKESNLMIRSIRDYFTTDMDEVLIDDPQVFKEAKDFFQMVMPDHVKIVKLHQERRPIFSRYQIEDQIETLSRNKVPLPSGGSIVIDPTEALVAIDVNSGKMASEQGVEATATKTNLEAAEEVGRQLRLRDLGGLIVIDFIDMRERKHMRQVENQVKKSLENDKARVNVGRISQFGLLELSRQRIKAALTEGSYLPCPHCLGAGRLKSPETQAASLLRKIHASAAKGQISRVDAQLPLEVAEYMLNNKREELVEMERDHKLHIHIHGNRDFLADQVEIEIIKKEKEKSTQQEFVSAGSLPMPAAEPDKKEDDNSPQKAANAEGEGEPEAEGGKKRRRRRRRKPASATADTAQPTEQEAAEAQPDETSTDKATTPGEENAPADVSAEETPVKKPQRRRRSSNRGKKPEETTPAESTESTTPSEATAPEEAMTTTPVSTDPEGAEAKPRPRRSRGRRKPKAAVESTAQIETTQEAQPAETNSTAKAPEELVPEQSNTEQPRPEQTETDQKPQRRRRRTARKPAQEKATEPATEESKQSPAETPVANASQEEKPAAKRPARRPRRKNPEAQIDQEQKSITAAKPAEGSSSADETVEKPKRTRRPRAKQKPDVEVNKQQQTGEQAEVSTEKQPARKTTSRRAPRKAPVKKAASETKTTGETVDKVTSPPGENPAEPPKPRRRRAVKKKPAEETPLPSDQ